jgi:sugar phosphate isomerase/epimerase
LEEILDKAASMGYEGVELRCLLGQNDLTLIPELTSNPESVKSQFVERGVELICLGTSAHFVSPHARDRQANLALAMRHVELAAGLGCSKVRVSSGSAPRGSAAAAAKSRAGQTLATLGRFAADHGVAIVVENEGELGGSEDLWFLTDAAGHPAVECCWNPVQGLRMGDRPTTVVPRLRKALGLVHLCDAEIDPVTDAPGYVLPGQGQVEFERLIDLLRGVGYRGFLVFEWPGASLKGGPDAEQVLSQARAFAAGLIEARQAVLSAYKGDKRPVRFRQPAS